MWGLCYIWYVCLGTLCVCRGDVVECEGCMVSACVASHGEESLSLCGLGRALVCHDVCQSPCQRRQGRTNPFVESQIHSLTEVIHALMGGS